ncbi:MAG: hypothetical protein MHPSP_000469 [Paramarteilia canceri]
MLSVTWQGRDEPELLIQRSVQTGQISSENLTNNEHEIPNDSHFSDLRRKFQLEYTKTQLAQTNPSEIFLKNNICGKLWVDRCQPRHYIDLLNDEVFVLDCFFYGIIILNDQASAENPTGLNLQRVFRFVYIAFNL